MLNGKIQTLRYCFALTSWGHGFRSKKILFLIELLNHIGHEKKKLRNQIKKYIKVLSINNYIIIKLK